MAVHEISRERARERWLNKRHGADKGKCRSVFSKSKITQEKRPSLAQLNQRRLMMVDDG
jgi:hypothetical protein